MLRILARTRHALAPLVFLALLAVALPAHAQRTDPNAPVEDPDAGAVKEQTLLQHAPRIQGRIDIPEKRASVLIQPAGRTWVYFHEVTLHWLGAIVILGMIALLALGYWLFGRIRISAGRSGKKVKRFSAFERFSHWLTAVSFVVLALTGLNITFGKLLLLPLIGPEAFSTFSQGAKYAHNFVGFSFMVGLILIVTLWLKDNIPKRVDVDWLKQGGGFIKSKHASAGRFNAGEKMVFWLALGAGAAIAVSGTAAAVSVLRHQHCLDASCAGSPRQHRGSLHRLDSRSHLHRHPRHGGRLRGHGDGRSGSELGQGTPRSMVGGDARERTLRRAAGPSQRGPSQIVALSYRASSASGRHRAAASSPRWCAPGRAAVRRDRIPFLRRMRPGSPRTF